MCRTGAVAHTQRAVGGDGFGNALDDGVAAQAEHAHRLAAQQVARRVGARKAGEALALELQGGAHQRQGHAVQHRVRFELRVDLAQAGKAMRQVALCTPLRQRLHVQADADDDHAARADGDRLDQHAAQLAAAARAFVQPQVVRPLERDARRGAAGLGRIERVGQGHADGQRQATPVARRQRQAEREGQRRPGGRVPDAVVAAAPDRLVLGHQQTGLRVSGATAIGPASSVAAGAADLAAGFELAGCGHQRVALSAAHARTFEQQTVGGLGACQNLDRQARQVGLELLPQRVGLPVQVRRSDGVGGHGDHVRTAGGGFQRLGASIVPRHLRAPQRQAYSAFSLAV